ncbi:hypothetical protein DITRI_Ditri20bG0142500 [Diplodiscus trichospermus]
MKQAEDYLNSLMEAAMDEFRQFEEEMERMSMAEMKCLEETTEKAREMGNLEEKSSIFASKKYIDVAV